MFKELRRDLLPPKNPRRHGKSNRGLKVICRVLLPDFPRATLMELMNQVVEVSGSDFASLPAVEVCPEIEESVGQFAIVGDGRPFSNQMFESLGSVLHGSLFLSAERLRITSGAPGSRRVDRIVRQRQTINCSTIKPSRETCIRADQPHGSVL